MAFQELMGILKNAEKKMKIQKQREQEDMKTKKKSIAFKGKLRGFIH